MRSPLVAGISTDQIPAQVSDRDELGRNIRRRSVFPYDQPILAALGEMEVAHVLDRTYGSCPVQANPHFCIRVAGVQGALLLLLQAEKGTHPAARSNPVLYECLLRQSAAGSLD